jgi:hypothetical protein
MLSRYRPRLYTGTAMMPYFSLYRVRQRLSFLARGHQVPEILQ